MAGVVWTVSLTNTSVHTGLMLRLPFCRSNVVEHFCEIPAL